MLDFVAVAMAGILPILYWSISLAKKGKVGLHRFVQVVLGLVLLVAVTAFELDMRLNGWKHLAEPSPHYDTIMMPSLYVHLCFSIPTTLLWLVMIIWSLKKYDRKDLKETEEIKN